MVFALYILGAYSVARLRLGPLGATAVGLTTALHSSSLFMSDLCFPEILFGLVCIAALFVHARWRPSWQREAAVGDLGDGGLLLRNLGLALLVAWVLDAALHRGLPEP